MKVIIIGDIVGKPGRAVLTATLKRLKDQHEAEFVIANVENAAEGAGLIPKVGDEILAAGVDVMTSGNHIFDKKEVIGYIEKQPRLLRPANYAPDAPGRGLCLGSTTSGTRTRTSSRQSRGRRWLASRSSSLRSGAPEHPTPVAAARRVVPGGAIAVDRDPLEPAGGGVRRTHGGVF